MLTQAAIDVILKLIEDEAEKVRRHVERDEGWAKIRPLQSYALEDHNRNIARLAELDAARRELEALRGQEAVWWPVEDYQAQESLKLISGERWVVKTEISGGRIINMWDNKGCMLAHRLRDGYAVCQLVPQEGMAMQDCVPVAALREILQQHRELVGPTIAYKDVDAWLHNMPWDAARGER